MQTHSYFCFQNHFPTTGTPTNSLPHISFSEFGTEYAPLSNPNLPTDFIRAEPLSDFYPNRGFGFRVSSDIPNAKQVQEYVPMELTQDLEHSSFPGS